MFKVNVADQWFPGSGTESGGCTEGRLSRLRPVEARFIRAAHGRRAFCPHLSRAQCVRQCPQKDVRKNALPLSDMNSVAPECQRLRYDNNEAPIHYSLVV